MQFLNPSFGYYIIEAQRRDILKENDYNSLNIRDKVERQKEIIKVFLRLGFFAFGGPAAHIAMMEEEIINKRKWINHDKFMDLIGATNLIPGPNSTEIA
ncbi:hypothetical protein C3E90_04485, partial [Clostridium sp. Cult2]|nr:hypothetical protein [Clostridium sp. Cult2]